MINFSEGRGECTVHSAQLTGLRSALYSLFSALCSLLTVTDFSTNLHNHCIIKNVQPYLKSSKMILFK